MQLCRYVAKCLCLKTPLEDLPRIAAHLEECGRKVPGSTNAVCRSCVQLHARMVEIRAAATDPAKARDLLTQELPGTRLSPDQQLKFGKCSLVQQFLSWCAARQVWEIDRSSILGFGLSMPRCVFID